MHIGISGKNRSGKTWCAQYLCQKLHKQGTPIMVYDPKYNDGNLELANTWCADFITNDKQEFLKHFWTNTHYLAVVEEADDFNKLADAKITTLGRTLANTVICSSQSAVQIIRRLRKECDMWISFLQGKKDCQTLQEEFIYDDWIQCMNFQRYEFFAGIPIEKYKAHGSTMEAKGKKILDELCKRILDDWPEAEDSTVQLHGCYDKPNWAYLEKKGLIYED